MIPCLISPLLNEVWIALGQSVDLFKSSHAKFHTGRLHRTMEGLDYVLVRQRPNVRETEDPLGIGFLFTGQSGEDRQTGPPISTRSIGGTAS